MCIQNVQSVHIQPKTELRTHKCMYMYDYMYVCKDTEMFPVAAVISLQKKSM